MNEGANGIPSRAAQERFRQEHETFELHKKHQQRWFTLQLILGYASIVVMAVIMAVCAYVVLRPDLFKAEVVNLAVVGLLADTVALMISVWRIVLDPDFRTQLAPVAALHNHLTE